MTLKSIDFLLVPNIVTNVKIESYDLLQNQFQSSYQFSQDQFQPKDMKWWNVITIMMVVFSWESEHKKCALDPEPYICTQKTKLSSLSSRKGAQEFSYEELWCVITMFCNP